MKIQTNSLTWKILKIIWFIFGGFILFFTLVFLIKMQTVNSLGVIGAALLFAVGLYAIAIFVLITLLFLLIKWMIKKWKKKKSLKQEK